MNSYYQRIVVVSLTLAVLTVAVIAVGPRLQAQIGSAEPQGQNVPITSSVRVAFSEAVDQVATERGFQIEPSVSGDMSWQQDTFVFTPNTPLGSNVTYNVSLKPVSARGATAAALTWSFHTRSPRLIYIGAGGSGIWALENGTPRQINAVADITSFAISPDGTRIAYSVRREGNRQALFLFDTGTNTTHGLVDTPNESARQPDWSPADDFIAYERSTRTGDTWQAATIWLAQSDGTPLGPITLGASGGSPRFAPLDLQLAFVRDQQLTVVNISGVGRSFLNDVHGRPEWSPNGEQVGILAGPENAPSLQIVDTLSRNVLPTPQQPISAFSWLPNASIVAASGSELLLNWNSSTPTVLHTPCTAISAIVPAPDGSTLAVTCGVAENQILLVPLANPQQMSILGAGSMPHWAP